MSKTVLEMAREANDYATAALGVNAIPREWRALRDEQFAAIVREDEREKQQEPVVCHDCNGSGEMETGIGMMVCDSCHGSCVKDPLTVQNHSGEAADMVAEQERAPITEPVVPWLSHKVAEQAEQEPVAWQGAEEWEPLAFQLCADENGEESCNELLWDGGVIPEPWGDRWLKYEDEAKRMIEYVRKYAAPVRTKDLTDDEIDEIFEANRTVGRFLRREYARAVIAADREKNK